MNLRRLFLFLLSVIFVFQVDAQISVTPNKKVQSQQQDQIKIDNQLATQYFRDHDYEKARDLYEKLFEKTGQSHHFQQYVDCLLFLKDYDKAEKALKSYIKKNPNYYKSLVDLVYVYTAEQKTDKAKKQSDEILKKLPENASTIRGISNAFQSRGLLDLAVLALQKGNELLGKEEDFYMDMAYIHHSTANYKEAFHYYLLELEAHPGQYNNIRNRLQSMLFYDVNNNIADELRISLLQHTREKPDNIEFAQILVWFALQQEDYDIALAQSKSIDRRTHDQDEQIINLSDVCMNNKQFDIAKEGYAYVLDKGKSNPYYGKALAGAINADYQKLQAINSTDRKAYARLSEAINKAYDEINTNDVAKLLVIQADIMAFQLQETEKATRLLIDNIDVIPSKQGKADLKIHLADIYLHCDEIWEATLLYSQVDKSLKEEPLGHEARFKNAQLRYFIGEYEWAESQLKVLKAATSKLIANDAMTLSLIIKDNLEADTSGMELKRLARADFKIYQRREDEAVAILDEIIGTGNEISIPHALFRKSELAEKHKDFETAKQLYLQIVEQYPDSYMSDAALMNVALIEQNELKNKELAKQYYEKLIDEYPISIYTAQAKKNYRKL